MIKIEKLTKVYGAGAERTTVLDELDFSVADGEIFAVVGPSGAGKSTLAQCIALLERPTSGSVVVNGEELSQLSESALRLARRRIGTIFQADGLFARRTAAENVALPLEYLGVSKAQTRARVAELLDRVHLADKAKRYPHELSGGQRQRVGIARALALRPSVLLSDEATSGLDPESTASVVQLLRELRDELNLSIVFITHEMDTVVQVADAAARLDRGRIVESGRITDLVRDISSPLGSALRPHRTAQTPDSDAAVWSVLYEGDVPRDWISRLSADLRMPVQLLGASVESLGGIPVGHATIGVDTGDDELVRAALGTLHLRGQRVSTTAALPARGRAVVAA